MKNTRLFVGSCLCLAILGPTAFADPADSVVKVTAFSRFPDPTRPWEKGKPSEVTGSGVFLDNKRILTNAHVVAYASEIYVQWNQGDDKVEAKLQAISVDLDLATLTVADAKFFDKRKPLPRAKNLPKIKDGVTVFGFPRGGAGMSITKGEVSRINSTAYSGEGFGLQIQTSAPVNKGNSGGPAVVGDHMIGLVYAGLADAQNIGYIIPTEEINHFLAHIKDGRYTGKPRVNSTTRYQQLENEALRRMLQLDRSVQGVLVVHASSDFPLKEHDILTKIGDRPIDNRGNVQVEQGLSVYFMYMVPKLAGEKGVPVTVRRNGKSIQLHMPIDHDDPFVIKRYRGEPLPYFIHGPLVFVPAKAEDVNDFYARLNPFWAESALGLRRNDHVQFPGEEFVVVSAQFRHKITAGYFDYSGRVVKSINGKDIKNLRHFVETVRDSKGEFLKLEFADRASGVLAFDRREIEDATEQVLEDAGIAASRRGSPDMMAVWKGKKKAE